VTSSFVHYKGEKEKEKEKEKKKNKNPKKRKRKKSKNPKQKVFDFYSSSRMAKQYKVFLSTIAK